MKKKAKYQKGITLIALVITIIILLILAGVTIGQLTGNGIFDKAKLAKQKYENAQSKENTSIKELEDQMNNYNKNLPQNTPTTEEGTPVALKDGWGTETVRNIKTSDGTEVTEVGKVATVYAIAVGNGDTVPVPYGFYYVGGNLNTGVVISDNSDDRYGYNPETKQENDTTLDKTTYEYTTKLKGNQFVWIPCLTSEYKKCNTWNGVNQKPTTNDKNYANAYWDTTTPKAELSQIEKYGGFYVARYEAGLADTIIEFTENQKHTRSNQIYNKDGVPQSKAGVVPWMFIDWTHSKTNAESMYNNDYVSSGLITGTQWDVILNTLINKTDLTSTDMTDSSTWGNYRNTTLSYNGRLAIADCNKTNSNAWTLKPFGTLTSGTTSNYTSDNTYGDLLTTGASATMEKYHIFDLAGNLWEWTEENSRYRNTSLDKTVQDGTQYRVLRGGNCAGASSSYPACFRGGVDTVSYTAFGVGFRAVLYMK